MGLLDQYGRLISGSRSQFTPEQLAEADQKSATRSIFENELKRRSKGGRIRRPTRRRRGRATRGFSKTKSLVIQRPKRIINNEVERTNFLQGTIDRIQVPEAFSPDINDATRPEAQGMFKAILEQAKLEGGLFEDARTKVNASFKEPREKQFDNILIAQKTLPTFKQIIERLFGL